jgi:hypothetical protein
MLEPETNTAEIHPFEQFKATMRKLATVSKSDLDAQLKHHATTKTKQTPGPKPRYRKAD